MFAKKRAWLRKILKDPNEQPKRRSARIQNIKRTKIIMAWRARHALMDMEFGFLSGDAVKIPPIPNAAPVEPVADNGAIEVPQASGDRLTVQMGREIYRPVSLEYRESGITIFAFEVKGTDVGTSDQQLQPSEEEENDCDPLVGSVPIPLID